MKNLLGGRDPKAEWEQQAAFEEAERARAEQRAAAVFDSFVDYCPVAVEIYGVDGKLLRSNSAAERLLGKVPPPGLSLFETRGLRRTGLLEPQLKRVVAGARVETPQTWYDPTEIGLPGVPGSKVCFRATLFPLFDSQNSVTRIAAIYEDLTDRQARASGLSDRSDRSGVSTRPAPGAAPPELAPGDAAGDVRELEFRRRKLEQSLREAEERWRSFVDNARGYAVLRFTEEGRVSAVSPSIRETWGISSDTILTDPSAFFAQVLPEDLALVRETDASIRASGNWPERYRFRVRNKTTDAVCWVELRGAVSTALGRRTYDALVLDVTRLLELEHRQVRTSAALERLTGSTVDGISTLDHELRILTWSPAAEAATGLKSGEAVGRSITELYPDFDKAGFLPAIRRTLREQKTERHEAFYHDGREPRSGWFRVTSYPYEAGVLLVIRNLTRQYRTELDLRRSETRLQALLATPGLAVSLKDRDLRYQLANPPGLRTLGVPAEGAADGRTDHDFLKKPVADLLAEHDRRVLEGSGPLELELALPDAISPQSAWYRLVKTPYHDHAGDILGVLTVGWNITRQVLALQELNRRRLRLEELVGEHRRLIAGAEKELGRWQNPPGQPPA